MIRKKKDKVFTEKNPHINGFMHFKLMLFKGQLYLLLTTLLNLEYFLWSRAHLVIGMGSIRKFSFNTEIA